MFFITFLFMDVMYAQTYCWPNTQMACFYGDKITKVVFAGINHEDALCTTDSHGQKDLTMSVPAGQVSVGETYTLSVSVENTLSSGTERLRAWIDFNRNGVFESTESFFLGVGTGNTTLETNITIPLSAVPGTSRMRVMYRRTQTNALNEGDACHSYSAYRGQVKDYAISIVVPSPLPIQLVSFTGVSGTDGIMLDWTTASETNNDYFTVERSKDGITWHVLGNVSGVGNSNVTNHYVYMDFRPDTGIGYYRLKQTDYNGDFEYFPMISVMNEARVGDIGIYPNPFHDFLMVEPMAKNAIITLRNGMGQLIQANMVRSDLNITRIDGLDLPTGIYILSIHTDGKTETFKVLKY